MFAIKYNYYGHPGLIVIFDVIKQGEMRLKNFNLALGSQIFKACADESRLRILHLVFVNEQMCISDLEKILEFTQTKTSRHLTYLRNSGIVNFRRHQHWVLYSIKEEVFDILKQIFQFLRKDPQLLHDQQIYQTLFTNRELAVNRMPAEFDGGSYTFNPKG